jgi:hypothetical protein
MGDDLELRLSTHSDRFDENDDAWIQQEADLMASLRGEVTVRRDMVAAPGEKGLVEGIILALGSAGAFKAAVDCLRAWLGRDRTRRIELSWTVDGREERIVLQGTAVSDAEFDRLAALVRAKAAGSS